MEASDILEDKDNGPEVQINFPESVMSRIEELMGGNDQFDSAEFDPVAYINKLFPTEQSLSGVEAAAARCEFRLAGVQQDIRQLVRAHAEQRKAGHAALVEAHRCIKDLALQVTDINKRAETSEGVVRGITAEIKALDVAKWNLTGAIAALNQLHMLAGGVVALQGLAEHRQYAELLPPLQAVTEVLRQLEPYADIAEVAGLRGAVAALRDQLATQTTNDFKMAFTGGNKGGMSAAALSETCAVVDALEPHVRRDLVDWLVGVQLQEYAALFAASQEASWLAHVEQRYSWLKQRLVQLERSPALLAWAASRALATAACQLTRRQLGEVLAARRSELDVKLLLFAVQKTRHFETLLHKRFQGADAGESRPDDAPAPAHDNEWLGAIGACFEPHLSLYVAGIRDALRDLVTRFVQEAKAAAAAPLSAAAQAAAQAEAEAGAGGVIASCAELFVFYKNSLVQCAALTTGQPMLELAGVFAQVLSRYTTEVLVAALPPAPGLVSNLHTLLRDDTAVRYSHAELVRITSVLVTAEYCAETSAHLEVKLREKVSPELAPRVSLLPERTRLLALVQDCLQLLLHDLEAAISGPLSAIPRAAIPRAEGSPRDPSPYVTAALAAARPPLPAARRLLAPARKYYTQLCTRFASSFISKFLQNVYKCRPLSPAGAEQLLLDAHTLKNALLTLPSVGSEVPRPAPATYTRVVVKQMSRVEMVLKLVLAPAAPPEPLAQQCAALLPDLTTQELHSVLAMRGLRLSKPQLAAIDQVFKNALAEHNTQ